MAVLDHHRTFHVPWHALQIPRGTFNMVIELHREHLFYFCRYSELRLTKLAFTTVVKVQAGPENNLHQFLHKKLPLRQDLA